MDADGATVRRLTNDPDADRLPAWSQDGKWITFSSNRIGNFDIYVVDAGGGEPMKVVEGEGTFGVFGAAWTYHQSND